MWRRNSTHGHSFFVRLLEGLWVQCSVRCKIFTLKWQLSSPINQYHRPVVRKVGHVPPPPIGPWNKDGKLWGSSNFCVGYRTFTAWIKYFKFNIESKVPFPLASPAARKAKLYIIALPTSFFFSGICFQFRCLFVVMSM